MSISGNYPDLAPHFGANHDFDDDLNKAHSAPAPLASSIGGSFLDTPFGSAPPPQDSSPLNNTFGSSSFVDPTASAFGAAPAPVIKPTPTSQVSSKEAAAIIPSPPLEREMNLPPASIPSSIPSQTQAKRSSIDRPAVRQYSNPIYKDFKHDGCVFHDDVEEFAESVLLFARAYGLAKKSKDNKSQGRQARVPRGFEHHGGRIVPFGMSIFPSTNYNFNVNSGNTTNIVNKSTFGSSRSKQDIEKDEERKRRQSWRASLGVASIIGIPILAYVTGSQVSALLYIGSVEHNRKAAEKVTLQSLALESSSVNPDVRLVSRTIKLWEKGALSLRKHNFMSLSFKFGTIAGAGSALAGYLREDDRLTTTGGVAALIFLSLGVFEFARFSFRSSEIESNIARAAQCAEEILNKKEAHSFNPTESTNPNYNG